MTMAAARDAGCLSNRPSRCGLFRVTNKVFEKDLAVCSVRESAFVRGGSRKVQKRVSSSLQSGLTKSQSDCYCRP